MMRRLAIVFVVISVLAVGCQSVAGTKAAGSRGRAGATAPQKPLIIPDGYEKLVLTVDLSAGKAAPKPAAPAKGKAPAKPAPSKVAPAKPAPSTEGEGRAARGGRRGGGRQGGHGQNCPQTQVGAALGITIGQPHGCIVKEVLPSGPAGKAGLKTGDSIVEADGKTVTCPSVLAPCLADTAQPGKVKLTILRRKGAGAAAGKPANPRTAAGKGATRGK